MNYQKISPVNCPRQPWSGPKNCQNDGNINTPMNIPITITTVTIITIITITITKIRVKTTSRFANPWTFGWTMCANDFLFQLIGLERPIKSMDFTKNQTFRSLNFWTLHFDEFFNFLLSVGRCQFRLNFDTLYSVYSVV